MKQKNSFQPVVFFILLISLLLILRFKGIGVEENKFQLKKSILIQVYQMYLLKK